jgi:hypothetical protein
MLPRPSALRTEVASSSVTSLPAHSKYGYCEVPQPRTHCRHANWAPYRVYNGIVDLLCPEVDSDRLCGLVVRVLGYRSGGPVRFPGLPEKNVVGLERGALSLVSTN